MNDKYIHIYNNLINYTRNKDLYKNLNRVDNFSDRLILFLLHFAFFLKNFKNDENEKKLQEIYDFNFIRSAAVLSKYSAMKRCGTVIIFKVGVENHL